MFAVGLDVGVYLVGQFAGRGQHQRAQGMAGWGNTGAGMWGKAGQNRQGERGGFAGAGLCSAEYIAACEDDGDGFCLNRCWIFIALFGNGF